MLATERDNYCISLLSIDGQGIRQALVDEFLRKQIAAQTMCTIVKCKRVGVLEKDVKHGAVLFHARVSDDRKVDVETIVDSLLLLL